MTKENFIKEQWIPIILAFIFAIIAEIILKPIRRFLGWTRKNIKKLFATKKFEQKYREWLINRFKFLNVRGIKTNAPVAIELEKVFVFLRVKGPKSRWAFEEFISKVENEEFVRESENLETIEAREKIKNEFEILERMEIIKLLSERNYELKELLTLTQKRLIVIGTPGSGKTTLLNYLALKFARKSVKEVFGIENNLLPIFINLRDTTKGGFLDIKKFVENYNNYIEFPHSPPEDFFKKKLDEGNCLILLDGLDEVADVEQRFKVAKWVDELATAYPKNIFIATSRPYGYETARLYNDFLELHILDFALEQIEEFIKYWTRTVNIKVRGDDSAFTLKQAEKEADDLLKAIKEHPKIEALTVNPLLLTIISLVHRYRGHLPERRVELYDECCDVLLFHWDAAKGIARELKATQKRVILQPIAFHLHKNGLREEKREKVIEYLENELPKIGIPKEKAGDLLNDIKDRCGILVETKLGYFGFTHLTFQEFLTARYISDNSLENFLLTKKRDKYWLEVTLLYCGMKDTTNLLNKILEEKEDLFYTNLFLAGRCLAESLSASTEMRTRITKALYNIYWNTKEFNLSRETALGILKEIKDQKIIQKFIENTKAKESDVRGRAAYALGQIKAESAVLPLIELLKDEESYVRGRAAYALGQIKAESAVLPLIELLKDKEIDVIVCAAYALGQIKAESAVLPLIELLKDEDSEIRGSAADVLGQIKSENAVSPLIDLLKDEDSEVRGIAADALGQIKSENAVSPLIDLLKDEDSEVRGSAADALGETQAEEAVEPLIELLKDKKSVVRRHAADALGEIQAEEAVEPLIELLKDEDSKVRGSAADALGEIGDKKAVESLKSLLNDIEEIFPFGEVKVSAFNALKEISERTNTPIYKD